MSIILLVQSIAYKNDDLISKVDENFRLKTFKESLEDVIRVELDSRHENERQFRFHDPESSQTLASQIIMWSPGNLYTLIPGQ